MSAYIYAIIPYSNENLCHSMDGDNIVLFPNIQALDGIDSEFTDPEGLELHEDFLLINTCCRQSFFTNNKEGYCRLRAEICRIAKALCAQEVWYAEELAIEEMDNKSFSFPEWVRRLRTTHKQYVAELTREILEGNTIYSYYHDDFSDIIMENPHNCRNVDG
ncbi:MAG: hypothetical protein IJP65_04835 [Bacteroidales bacterium]|nr:hypothetical protein [Bacteroidales bacterium]MBR0054609.1 hypothetical protein [Bacteroidales bacterium]